jgi:hypothetical protein
LISPRAFGACFLLRKITVPLSAETVAASAFEGCSNLAAFGYAGTLEEWSKVKVSGEWPDTLLRIACTDGEIRLSA